MYSSTYPEPMQALMKFLHTLQLDTQLYYRVPMAVMLLLGVFVLLGGISWLLKKTPIAKYGEIFLNMIRGMLVAVLLVLALLAVFNYTSFGKFRYASYLNAYEFYHYYMGSKYARELQSTELYNASLVADKETGLKYRNSKKSIRDLATGRYTSVDSVLRDKDRIKGLFTDARWEEFREDIRWFKTKLSTGRWNGVLRDKGYNASPVWSMMVGGFLSNQVPTTILVDKEIPNIAGNTKAPIEQIEQIRVSNDKGMLLLALIDPLLILMAFLCVCWAFGPRAALIMIALLGTHYMMKFSHMKGAYIRTDFAMTLVMTACMIKKNRYGLAGILMAWSTLTRVFPAVFLFGIGVVLLWRILAVLGEVLVKVKAKYADSWDQKIFYALCALPHVVLCLALGGAFYAGMNEYWTTKQVRDVIALVLALETLTLAPVALWGLWTKRIPMRYVRFFVFFFVTIAILVVSSIAYDGGLGMWKDYKEKIVRHNNDISPWRVGFKYLFIAKFGEPDTSKGYKNLPTVLKRPGQTKPEVDKLGIPNSLKDFCAANLQWFPQTTPYTRSLHFKENPKIWWSIMATMLIFCLFAMRGFKDHEALLFGFVPTFFMVSPTYYYYIMLVVPLLFLTLKLERPDRALGIVWMFFTGMTGYYCYSMWQQKFHTYFWMSAMVMVLVAWMMLLALFEGKSKQRGLLVLGLSACVMFYFYKIWPAFSPSEEFIEANPVLAPAPSWAAYAALVVMAYGLALAFLQIPFRYLRPADGLAPAPESEPVSFLPAPEADPSEEESALEELSNAPAPAPRSEDLEPLEEAQIAPERVGVLDQLDRDETAVLGVSLQALESIEDEQEDLIAEDGATDEDDLLTPELEIDRDWTPAEAVSEADAQEESELTDLSDLTHLTDLTDHSEDA